MYLYLILSKRNSKQTDSLARLRSKSILSWGGHGVNCPIHIKNERNNILFRTVRKHAGV